MHLISLQPNKSFSWALRRSCASFDIYGTPPHTTIFFLPRAGVDSAETLWRLACGLAQTSESSEAALSQASENEASSLLLLLL